MIHLYIDNIVADDRPGFPTTMSLTGEVVARDRDGYKAVVTGPGIFEVFVDGQLKKTQIVGAEVVDISLNDIMPVNAAAKVGTGVSFTVRTEGEPAENQTHYGSRYRFVQGSDYEEFDAAWHKAEQNKRLQETSQREGPSRLYDAANHALLQSGGLSTLSGSCYCKCVIKALTGREYLDLASDLSGNGRWSVSEVKAAFDILLEPLVKGLLFTLPNPAWFHRAIMESVRRQKEPLPLKLEYVEAYFQELRDSGAGKLLAAKLNQHYPFSAQELVYLVRSGAVQQDECSERKVGRLRVNRAFMPKGHESSLNYFFRLSPYDK